MEPSAPVSRILAVDDNPSNLRLLMSLLAPQSYIVHPATSGQVALMFLENNLPDLVLLDAVMPGMDGYQFCERLQANERTRDIPVIFISAADQNLNKARAFACGAADYIAKPFLAEEVLARIATHLHLQRLRRHLEEAVAARTAELQARIAGLAAELAACQREKERLSQAFEASGSGRRRQ